MATVTGFITTPGAFELVPGGTVAVSATLLFSNSTTQDVTSQTTWTTSGNIGWIDTRGYFTGTASGIGSVNASFTGAPASGTLTASSSVVVDQISPVTLGSIKSILGQTVVVLGIVPNLVGRQYYIPYPVDSLRTVTTFYGNGRFTQAIGEVQRQGAQSVLAVAMPDENHYSQLFDTIADLSFDILHPAGLLATSGRISTFTTLASMREFLGHPICIVMDADPTPGTAALVSSPIGVFAGTNPHYYPPTTYSRNFVFTLDTLTINPNVPAQYTAPSGASVAGLLARNLPQDSLTNTSLYGALLPNPYQGTDPSNLASAGYLILRQSVRHGVVPYLAVSGASNITTNANFSTYYHRLTTVRIVNYVIASLHNGLQPYIGTSSTVSSIKTAEKILKGLVTAGVILMYQYVAVTKMVTGKIHISVVVLAPYETRTISLRAQVQP